MNKLKIAVVVAALLLPSAAQAQRGGAQSTQRQYIFDSRGKAVGFYYGPSSSSGHFNGMQQGVGDHSGEYNPFGAPLPKIKAVTPVPIGAANILAAPTASHDVSTAFPLKWSI